MEGFVLNIPEDMLRRLDDADGKIEKLAKTADTTKEKLIKAFKDINARGVNDFIAKLHKANLQLEELGKKKVSLKFDVKDNIMDSINNILNGANQVNSISEKTKDNSLLNVDKLNEENQLIAQLKQNIKTIDEMLKKGKNEDKQPLTDIDQQRLVDMRGAMKEELKLQEMTTNEKIELERKKTNEMEKLKEKQIKAEKKAFKEQQKLLAEQEKQKNQTYSGALDFSKKADTINKEIEAIKHLTAARNNLSRTDANYKKKVDVLNSAILKHKINIEQTTAVANNLKAAHKGLLNTADQLTRKLALVFSISQVSGYVSKLIAVRGEFELQRKSLQAILKDKEQANKLFNQVTKLAVQSPFQIKELVTYTKQLAAYRIETGKLYDTTKMLADISAGVGVDMSRLVLAYGQVSSANYLRGTELRQFSEAGINVLGGLADYFTELEGRIVGVDEVFDRVSKRMVLFEDVEAVLKRMTDEGGDFYNMQAIQSQTLKGMVSNLKDSIDLMFNDIGGSHEGLLKKLVSLAKDLVDNWRAFASVLKIVGTSIAVMGLAQFTKGLLATSQALELASISGNKFMVMGGNLKKMLSSITSTNPWVLVAGAIVTAFVAINDYLDAIDEANAKYDENSVALEKSAEKLEDIQKQVNDYNDVIKKSSKVMEEQKKGTEEYNDAENRAALAMKENATLLATIKDQYPNIYQEVIQNADGTLELAAAVEEYNKQVEFSIALEQRKKGDIGRDDFDTNYQEAVEELNEYRSALASAKYEAINVGVTLQKSMEDGLITEEQRDTFKGLIDDIKNAKGLEETYEKIQLLNKELAKPNIENWGALIGHNGMFNDFRESFDEMTKQKFGQGFAKGWFDAIKDLEGNFDEQMTLIQGKWNEMNFDMNTEEGQLAAKEWGENIIKELGIVDTEVQKVFKDWLEKANIHINWEIEAPKVPEITKDSEWVKNTKEAINKALSGIPNKIESDVVDELYTRGESFAAFKAPTDNAIFEEYAKKVKEEYEARKELYEQAHTSGQKVFNEKDIEEIDQAYNSLKQVMKILGLLDEKQKGGGGNERMKGMIDLIREMNAKYKELNKTFDETESKQRVLASYQKTFKRIFAGTGIKIEDIDFIDERGVVKSLEKLWDIVDRFGKDAKDTLEHNLSQVKVEYDIEVTRDSMQQSIEDIDHMMDDYQISLELQKMDISPEAAKNLFGVESMTLPELREETAKKAKDFTGDDYKEKEYKERLEKIDKMIEEQQQERLKKYLEYTREAISEEAKMKIDSFHKLKEIEESFIPKEGASEEEKNAMIQAKAKAIEGVMQEMQSNLDKLSWEEFQKTDTFLSLFDDLSMASSSAIQNMIYNLEEYKKEWTDMPLEDVKRMTESLNKLKDALADKENPFALVRNLKAELGGTTIEESEQKRSNAELNIVSNNDTIAQIEFINQLINENVSIEEIKAQLEEKYYYLLGQEGDKTDDIIKKLKEKLELLKKSNKEEGKKVDDANREIDLHNKIIKAYQKQREVLSNAKNMANDLYDAFASLYETFGGDSDNPFAVIAGTGKDMMNIVINAIMLKLQLDSCTQGALAFGTALNTAMGVIGWIVMAIQLLVAAFTAIAKIHDNRLQKQIEKDAAAIEVLKKRMEELDEYLDNSMSIFYYTKAYDELNASLRENIDLLQDMKAAEKDKKKSDEDQIKDYEKQIEEAQDKIKENHEKFLEDMGGFGSAENKKSAAEDFIDAWYEAFKETGDGIDALEEKWDEYFDNLLKKQLLMKVGERRIQRYVDEIDEMLEKKSEGGAELTKNEFKRIEEIGEEIGGELNSSLKKIMEGWGVEGGNAQLEGLSKGIQNITETTAQALEALLNSMRFYVIDTNSEVKKLSDSLGNLNALSFDSIFDELQNQTALIDNIKDLVDSVVVDSNISGHRGKALAIRM